MCHAIRRCGSLRGIVLLAVTILLVVSHSAQAEFTGGVLTVEAISNFGSASHTWDLPAEPADRLVWSLGEKYDFLGNAGQLIGSINQAVVTLEGDPAVGLSFAVNAGNADVTFTITTAAVSFPALTSVTGFASAGVTLTDGNPLPGNGASLSPAKENTGLYQATYNGGVIFSDMLPAQSIAGKGTISANADSGMQAIGGAVTDIQASYAFTLSANDSASGSSQFEVTGVPEPSVFVMIVVGLISLVLGCRRR